jgi:hypothetical protein
MLLGQASWRVRGSCFANRFATGQYVCVFISLLSSSKWKRFTSLAGGAFLWAIFVGRSGLLSCLYVFVLF